MKIAISGDHAGLDLKNHIKDYVAGLGHEVVDHGAFEYDADDDFPDLAAPVARAVATKDVDRGIILCGSGVGASVAANKIPGVRAAMCHDTYSAAQGVRHDDMNVLCMAHVSWGWRWRRRWSMRSSALRWIHTRGSSDAWTRC